MGPAHVSYRGKRGQPGVLGRAQQAVEHEANVGDTAIPLGAAGDHDDTAGRTAPLPHADVAPPPAPALLHADVIPPPVPVRAYLRAGVREVLRGAPAALAFAVAYRDVAGDGDLGLAAWARHGVIYPGLLLARAAAVRAANTLAGAHRLRADVAPPPAPLLHGDADLAPPPARLLDAARTCLRSFVRPFLREAPAAFAVAAADGDLGLAAWGRCALVHSVLLVARTAAVRAAINLAAGAHRLRPVDAVRDIVVLVLAVAAVLAAIYFP